MDVDNSLNIATPVEAYEVHDKVTRESRNARLLVVHNRAAQRRAVLLDLLVKALSVSASREFQLTSMIPDIKKLVLIEMLHESLSAFSVYVDGGSSGASGDERVLLSSMDIQSSTNDPCAFLPGSDERSAETT